MEGSFEVAFNQTKKFEGGRSNHKNDRGGATLYGISSKYWPEEYKMVDALVKQGREKEAEEFTKGFYKNNFWDKIDGDNLPQEIAPLVFDAAVNHGVSGSKKLLEQSQGDPNKFLEARSGLMDNIVKNDPSQAVFQKGWQNRINQQKPVSDDLTPDELAELQELEALEAQNDELTPEELAELEQLEALEAQNALQQPKEQGSQQGFLERLQPKLAERAQMERDITQARLRGEQGFIESGIQKAGKVGAGVVNDIIGEGLVSGFRALPDSIENPIREGFGRGVSALNNSFAGDMAQKAVESYGSFAEDHPRAARNIEAAANLGALVGAASPAKSQNVLNSAVDATGQGVKSVAKTGAGLATSPVTGTRNLYKGFKARDVEALEDAGQAIKTRSSEAYSKMREVGATFTPEASNKIIDKLENALVNDGRLNPELHKSVISVANQITDEIRTGDITLESLDLNRRLLSDVAGNFNDPTNARKATLMIRALDDAIEDIGTSDIASGSREAIDALKTGRSEYRRSKKFEDISSIVRKSDGDANYLKRELKKFIDNPKKTRGFSKEELASLKRASTMTAGEGLLKMLGKFGIDLGNSRIGNTGLPVIGGVAVGAGTASGGIGLAVPAVGTMARQGQKYLARGKVEDLLRVIESPSKSEMMSRALKSPNSQNVKSRAKLLAQEINK